MTPYPDHIINLTTLISGIFLALFGVFYAHKRKLSVYFLVCGVIFGLITVFFYWQNDILKRQVAKTEIESHGKDNAKIAYKNVTSHQLTPLSKPSKRILTTVKTETKPIQKPLTSSIRNLRPQITEDSPRIEQPELPVEKITVAIKTISSPMEEFPFGLSLIIQSTSTISPVHFLIECSGPIGKAQAIPASGISMAHSTWLKGNTFEFKFQFPPLTPEAPVRVEIFSASKVKVSRVVRIR